MSSATVRNILAELETTGLLTHPHTSAGRMPTDAGYRFYVETIVEAVPLPAVEQLMIRHQFGQVEFASEHWFRLAATTLAGLTRSAGLATPAKPRAPTSGGSTSSPINERMASLILVLREGAIKQAAITLDEADAIDQPTLNRVAALLNERLVDSTAAVAEATLAARCRRADPARCAPRRRADRQDRRASTTRPPIEEVFSDGLLNVMEAPEFAQSDKLRQVFTALENRAYLGELVGSVAGSGRIRVFIGAENPPREMHDVSLVLAPYGRPGRAIGVVGVLGPTRMCYRTRSARSVRVRSHERAGGSPLCLSDSERRAQERADGHRHPTDQAAGRHRGPAVGSSTRHAGRRPTNT